MRSPPASPEAAAPEDAVAKALPNRPRLKTAAADLRGAARLAMDATAGLTDLVEAMHQRIGSLPGGTAADGRTSGITGLVYRSIRGVTRLVGGSVDGLLSAVQTLLPALSQATEPAQHGPQREALVAALNGVLGDHLAATQNPLATSMTLRQSGRALLLERQALQARFSAPAPVRGTRLLVMIHGLCMNDRQWLREGHDHGAALERDAGYTPVYLHYNSGRGIVDNGREFAALMQQLLNTWPHPIERLVLLGHSMGGLVARSALHQGAQASQPWVSRVDGLVCLGTPHHGAPLERAGHGLDILLSAAPYAAPLARLGKLRSVGIADLRHGTVRTEDPAKQTQTQTHAHTRTPLPKPLPTPTPLPESVRCYAVAGTLGADAARLGARLATRLGGDGLVPVASALGRHKTALRTLLFPPERQWVAQGVGHMALLSDAGVYRQLIGWLRD